MGGGVGGAGSWLHVFGSHAPHSAGNSVAPICAQAFVSLYPSEFCKYDIRSPHLYCPAKVLRTVSVQVAHPQGGRTVGDAVGVAVGIGVGGSVVGASVGETTVSK